MVVSDHGVTNGGNHGGSTYEETDSLALFIGGELIMSDYASPTHKLAFQVIICGSIFFCYSYKIIEYIFFFFLILSIVTLFPCTTNYSHFFLNFSTCSFYLDVSLSNFDEQLEISIINNNVLFEDVFLNCPICDP